MSTPLIDNKYCPFKCEALVDDMIKGYCAKYNKQLRIDKRYCFLLKCAECKNNK